MKFIRVTKYDPKNRDINGHYALSNEWTSISDIGKLVNGQIFTMEQYLVAEETYIKAVEVLIQKIGLTNLKVVSLENHSNKTTLDLAEGKTIPQTLVKEVVRMILREKVWGNWLPKIKSKYILAMITICILLENAFQRRLSRNSKESKDCMWKM